jgi:adenosylhomocysteine nucleosidase
MTGTGGGRMTDPTPGRIAFVCAMPMELTPLRRMLSLTKARIGGVEVYEGVLGERPVVAVVTGMGTDLATAGTTALLEAVEVERVVVVGITGAVENETPIGTLVMPETVVNGNTGAAFRPTRIGDVEPAGTMWTTDVLITDLDEIAGLRTQGVVSLDMETAAIAEVCEGRGVPWSVFRVISDRATDGSVDDEVFRMSNQDGTANPKAVAAYFLKHPGRIPAMATMAKQAKHATERAATEAVRAVDGLGASGS